MDTQPFDRRPSCCILNLMNLTAVDKRERVARTDTADFHLPLYLLLLIWSIGFVLDKREQARQNKTLINKACYCNYKHINHFHFYYHSPSMKKVLLLTFFLMFITSMVFAQQGHIGVFADPGGMSCTLGMSTTTIYVVHISTSAATNSQWAIKAPLGLTHVATVAGTGNLLLGDAVHGAGVSYGACKSSPIYVALVIYAATPGPGPCDMISVQGNPSANPPGIYMTDCTTPNPIQYQILSCSYARFDDGSCPCD